MRHLQDTEEDPHQYINIAYHEPANSGRHAGSSLSDHIPSSSEKNNSSQKQQTPAPTRKIKASTRITFNQTLAQQNGSVPGAPLASTDGSADEPLVNHQVLVAVGTNRDSNSPHPNNVADLNQITIAHNEAAIQFNGNIQR